MLYLTPKETDALFSSRLSLKYNTIALTPTQYLTLMTLEEAKQLKPGDKVLVEMIIGLDPHDHRAIDSDGDVWFKYRYVKPEHIREKITPPRRKFKKGDIVSRNGHLYYVAEDEKEDGKVLLECWDDGIMHTRADLLTLERAVEDRKNITH